MRRLLLAAILLIPVSLQADTVTVYRTEAADGSVGFSDRAPDSSGPVEQIQLTVPEAGPADEHRARLEAIRETTDRMAADRRERERHRAALRESAARTEALSRPAETSPAEPPGYYVLRQPPRRHHHRPGPRPLPAIPAPAPGLQNVRAYNSQLMRSMLDYTR